MKFWNISVPFRGLYFLNKRNNGCLKKMQRRISVPFRGLYFLNPPRRTPVNSIPANRICGGKHFSPISPFPLHSIS